MTRKPRREAGVDNLLAKVMKRTAERGEENCREGERADRDCAEAKGQVEEFGAAREHYVAEEGNPHTPGSQIDCACPHGRKNQEV
jgi:hypothetical protein